MAHIVDPVCGMTFDENIAADKSEWLNRTFYFCHPICKQIFDAKPWHFVYNGNPKISRGKSIISKPKFKRSNYGPVSEKFCEGENEC